MEVLMKRRLSVIAAVAARLPLSASTEQGFYCPPSKHLRRN
jgi:hypothetical protein